MPMSHIPQKAEKFEIQAYKVPGDLKSLTMSHVAFSGSPRKHPTDPGRVILVADPFSTNTFYLEFKKGDISYAEMLPSIANPDGETITIYRIWVKKGCLGVRCTPFVVEDTMRVSGEEP